MQFSLLLAAASELSAPVPHDLTLPLPLSRTALVVLLVATFLLHILFVNLMVGGSVLTLFFEWRGMRRREPHLDRLAHVICQTITVNKSLAVVLGVGPLLMMNLLYTVWFYSANALTGLAWILLVPTVVAAFLLTYAQKYLWMRLEKRKAFHIALGAGAVLLFLFIPLIFLTNINLMLFPERWSEVRGFLSALLLPNVLPRYFHFLLASIAATALYMVWQVRRPGFLSGTEHPELAAPPLMRRFYRIAFWTTLTQFAAGPFLLFTLPRHGLGATTLSFILSGVGLGMGLLVVLWSESRAIDSSVGRQRWTATLLFAFVVLFMATGRHEYREASLAWHRELVTARTEEFRRLVETARTEAATRAEAEKSADPLVLGEFIYKQTCIACHQPTGVGLAGAFPPLAGSEWINEPDPGRIIRIVLHGIEGPIRVKGTLYPGAPMPAHRDLLDDRKVACVLTYVRQAWGNGAPGITPATVSEIRGKTSGRSKPWTELELGRPQAKQ